MQGLSWEGVSQVPGRSRAERIDSLHAGLSRDYCEPKGPKEL